MCLALCGGVLLLGFSCGWVKAAEPTGEPSPITPIPPPPPIDPRVITLGQTLFNDPGLSGDGKRACSACHDINTNGADGRRVDAGPTGANLEFNTTTLFNAGLAYRLGWRGDETSLEALAARSLTNPNVMDSSPSHVLKAIAGSTALRQQFQAIYHRSVDFPLVLTVIASYERSLVTPGSRFDLWLQGDKAALSPEALQGYHLFTSFGCVSCHQGVDVGANLFEPSGVYHPIEGNLRPVLLVPSLRNVAVTAPYFHDGSVATLEAAVALMGKAQLDRPLTAEQIKEIAAFLRSLTGRYQGRLLTQAR